MAEHNETIRDDDTREALGAGASDLEGKTIVRVLPVEDSDRNESLLVCSDGTSYLLSCDPGYDEDEIIRTPDKWEVVLYDATETDAGREFKRKGLST